MFIIQPKSLRKEAVRLKKKGKKADGFKEQQGVKIWERIVIPIQPESIQSIMSCWGEALKRKVRQLH